MHVCFHLINQSNCSISVHLLFLFCSCVFISRPYKNRSIFWCYCSVTVFGGRSKAHKRNHIVGIVGLKKVVFHLLPIYIPLPHGKFVTYLELWAQSSAIPLCLSLTDSSKILLCSFKMDQHLLKAWYDKIQ